MEQDNGPDYDAKAARSDRILAMLPTRRTCAGCDLCCTAVGVEDRALQKLPGVRCPNLAGAPGASCTIHGKHPIACREFLCLWRGSNTLLPDNLFPPRVGFVVALTGDFRSRPMVLTIHPDPAHPDSWKAPRHRETFKKLARATNAIVVVGQHHLARHIFAPSGNEYTRERHPELFKDNGGLIGLPAFDFLPVPPTDQEIAALLWA